MKTVRVLGNGVVIVGAQFGDEGKGKIVDVLAEKVDIIARYQGGANAGHTIVVDGKTFKFRLMPSGLIRSKRSLICAGVVMDPKVAVTELEGLFNGGISIGPSLLGIDLRAHVVLPWHKVIDAARQANKEIGTTGNGIGPAYEDSASRTGLRFIEFVDQSKLERRVREIGTSKNHALKSLVASGGTPVPIPETESVILEYSVLARKLKPFLCDASAEINQSLLEGKKVLFEGAQGTHLDESFGTYPFVTSSHPIAGGACIGAGVAPHSITQVHGVAKAYTTRVGGGPLPTEFEEEMGETIVKKGHEFGTVTGRKRRVGWFDACMLRRSQQLNGFDCLHITKIDVLEGIKTLKIAIGYKIEDGSTTQLMPADISLLHNAVPVYFETPGFEELGEEGWAKIVSQAISSGLDALPKHALNFIRKIEDEVGVQVASVSVGPQRHQILWAKNFSVNYKLL